MSPPTPPPPPAGEGRGRGSARPLGPRRTPSPSPTPPSSRRRGRGRGRSSPPQPGRDRFKYRPWGRFRGWSTPPRLDLSLALVLGESRGEQPTDPEHVVSAPARYYGPINPYGSRATLLLRTPPRFHESLHATQTRPTIRSVLAVPTTLPSSLTPATAMTPRSVMLAEAAAARFSTAEGMEPMSLLPLFDSPGSTGMKPPFGGFHALPGSIEACVNVCLMKFLPEEFTTTSQLAGFDSTVVVGTHKKYGKVLMKRYDNLDTDQVNEANAQIATSACSKLILLGVCTTPKDLILIYKFDFICSFAELIETGLDNLTLENRVSIVRDIVNDLKLIQTNLCVLGGEQIFLRDDFTAVILDFPPICNGNSLHMDLGRIILKIIPSDDTTVPAESSEELKARCQMLRFFAATSLVESSKLPIESALDMIQSVVDSLSKG